MISYTVKESHISSVFCKIHQYRQTDRHTDTDTQTQILLLFHKDKTNTEKENVEFEIT